MSRSTYPLIKVAVGVITNAQHQVLVALRPRHVVLGGLWEFPGGKIEDNETPLQALKRELYEEIGIYVIKAAPFMLVQHRYDINIIELDTWHVLEFEGGPHGREGQQVRWVNIQELLTLSFPEGNRSIIQEVIHLLE